MHYRGSGPWVDTVFRRQLLVSASGLQVPHLVPWILSWLHALRTLAFRRAFCARAFFLSSFLAVPDDAGRRLVIRLIYATPLSLSLSSTWNMSHVDFSLDF